jgi:hypothetical protein
MVLLSQYSGLKFFEGMSLGHSSDYFNKIDEAFDGLSSLIQNLNETSSREIASLSHRERCLIEEVSSLREKFTALNSQYTDKTTREEQHRREHFETQMQSRLEAKQEEEMGYPSEVVESIWNKFGLYIERNESGNIFGICLPESGAILKFILLADESGYYITSCDPLIEGMTTFLKALNDDTESGSLSRFLLKMRNQFIRQSLLEQ